MFNQANAWTGFFVYHCIVNYCSAFCKALGIYGWYVYVYFDSSPIATIPNVTLKTKRNKSQIWVDQWRSQDATQDTMCNDLMCNALYLTLWYVVALQKLVSSGTDLYGSLEYRLLASVQGFWTILEFYLCSLENSILRWPWCQVIFF